MAMTRSEAGALAIAAIGHAVLFGLLSRSVFLPSPDPEKLRSTPIEVSITDESAVESQAPVVSHEEVAAKLSPVEAPPEPEVAPPEPQPDPQPVAKPQPVPPRPVPAPDARPAPRQPPPKPAPAATPAKQQPRRDVRASGALDGIIAGLASQPTKGVATTPPAATAGPQVRSALAAEIIRQIKPHWTPPSGADTDQLRTKVIISLNRDGSLAGEPRVSQTGVTDTNRTQAGLARERAVRAVRLAAPFKLPAQYYDAWKTIAPILYEDL
jgi:outer membrane biosynthesis protein TonB